MDNNDFKWYMIGMAVILCMGFISIVYSDHVKSECKIEAIKNHVPIADAERLCN